MPFGHQYMKIDDQFQELQETFPTKCNVLFSIVLKLCLVKELSFLQSCTFTWPRVIIYIHYGSPDNVILETFAFKCYLFI